MGMGALWIVALSLFGAFSASAQDIVLERGAWSPPLSAPSPEAQIRPGLSFGVVQWNVHRFDDMAEARWSCAQAAGSAQELCASIDQASFVLIEEARYESAWRDIGDNRLPVSDKHLVFGPNAVDALPIDIATLGLSFAEKNRRYIVRQDPARTGTATYSDFAPLSSQVLMSNNVDNFWPQYMPAVATTYAIEGRNERLLVVHMHNLAGTGSDRQLELLDQAEAVIRAHQGPVLFAGDFNAWSEEKVNNLYFLASRTGLGQIPLQSPFPTPFGARQLDRAFVRGLELVVSSVHTLHGSEHLSDHLAVEYHLVIP